MKLFHNDGEGGNDRSAEKRARNQIGVYVRVFGNVSFRLSQSKSPVRSFLLCTMGSAAAAAFFVMGRRSLALPACFFFRLLALASVLAFTFSCVAWRR